MPRILWTLGRWLVGAGLLVVGARHTDRSDPWSMIPWAWLEANWIALACFSAAAVLFSYSPIKWCIDRQNSKDARHRVRANLAPGSFPETDAAEALRYLLYESVWGWKAYAKLNYWTMVDGIHFGEFERAAREGEIVTTGVGKREAVIERRFWIDGRIWPETATIKNGVVARAKLDWNRYAEWTQLAVAAADLRVAWPPASLLLRFRCRAWVWLKTVWYGTCLSNWLDKRRRRSKQEDPIG